MLSFISYTLAVAAGVIAIPVIVLLIEIIASLRSVEIESFEAASGSSTTRAAVVVPAHNESAGILPTIQDIKPQLKKGDRLLVIADNCNDDTAAVAVSAGAEVILRNDPEKIGKGYALGWGVRHLSTSPPDFVVFIDADCRIQSDMIGKLKDVCNKLQTPVQACFLMESPENSTINYSFAEFAWIIRNWARPLGLRSLHCPVQLMGTGMIFPWAVILSAPLASGNLVEDLKLGLDLAAVGKAPKFFPFVVGKSVFPMSDKGADSQRERWVQGHLSMIFKVAPRMLFLAITRRKFDLLVLTVDLLVPPLSLLGILVVGMFVLSSAAMLLGLSSSAMVISISNLLAFGLSILLAWLKFGREILPARSFLSIGLLVLERLRLYGRYLSGRTARQWIRTDRAKSK